MDVLAENEFPLQTLSCDGSPINATAESAKLLSDFTEMIEANKFVYLDDDSKVLLDLSFDVRTSREGSKLMSTTASVDRSGVKVIGADEIKGIGRFFRIGVTEAVPYTIYKRDQRTGGILRDENRNPVYEGYCIDVINELARKMNFTFELVEPKTGKFGKRTPDGGFDGLIGDLIRGETDFVVAALKMTAEREEQIDFVAPYFDQTGILIVMKKPQPDTSLFKFMTVLRLEVWLSILGALSVTAVVIWILEVFSPYSARNFDYAEQCR